MSYALIVATVVTLNITVLGEAARLKTGSRQKVCAEKCLVIGRRKNTGLEGLQAGPSKRSSGMAKDG